MFATKALAVAMVVATPISAYAGTFSTLYTFTGGADGGMPDAQLVYRDGELYGVTSALSVNTGNVFKFNLKTQEITVLYDFRGGTNGYYPNDLIYHSGTFYGTTLDGGGTGCHGGGCGTVFSLDAKTGRENVLYSFPDPGNGGLPQPGGLIYESGALYGVTESLGINNSGMIFAINLSTGIETTVFSFDTADGLAPNPSLVFNNGLLYGTAKAGGSNLCPTYNYQSGCGLVFSVNPTTGAESTLYSFTKGADGYWPTSNLIYQNGLLYGGTQFGGEMSCGRDGCGTFFSVDPITGAEDVLNANTGPAQVINGLTNHGRSIYETLSGTYRSRHINFGELVKIDLGSGHRVVLHKFTGGADGSHPGFPLAYHGGVYYGTTFDGAHSGCLENVGCGTIFQYVP